MTLPFGIIDICFVAILVISGILAYLRGFVREVLAVAAWVGATVITLYGFPPLKSVVRDVIENQMLADITAGAGLFVVALALLTILAQLAARQVRDSAASNFDRSLGFAFGVLRGVILVSLLYLSAAWFWGRDNLPDAITEARTFPLIEGSAEILLTLVPEDARVSAEGATGLARKKADRALSADKALRRLLDPKPERPKTTKDGRKPKSYRPSERNEMQRLIESKQ